MILCYRCQIHVSLNPTQYKLYFIWLYLKIAFIILKIISLFPSDF